MGKRADRLLREATESATAVPARKGAPTATAVDAAFDAAALAAAVDAAFDAAALAATVAAALAALSASLTARAARAARATRAAAWSATASAPSPTGGSRHKDLRADRRGHVSDHDRSERDVPGAEILGRV